MLGASAWVSGEMGLRDREYSRNAISPDATGLFGSSSRWPRRPGGQLLDRRFSQIIGARPIVGKYRDMTNDPSTPPLFPGLEAPPAIPAARNAATDTHEIAKAMALLWTYRPRSAIYKLLPLLGLTRSDGRAFTHEDVKRALAELHERGGLMEMPGRDGYFRLRDELRGPSYRALLDAMPAAMLREALRNLDRHGSEFAGYHWPPYDTAATVAMVRLELFSGTSAGEIERMRGMIQRSLDWNEILWMAALPAFDAALFERITPEWRWALAFAAISEMCLAWRAEMMPVAEWALTKLDGEPDSMPQNLRLALAELLVHRGERSRAQQALGTRSSRGAEALPFRLARVAGGRRGSGLARGRAGGSLLRLGAT